MPEKSLEQVRTFATMVAAKQGWTLSTDADFMTSLLEGLMVNWNRYGYFLCPCRDSEGSRELDAKTICPCAWSRADIESHGHCYCALYLSHSFAESGRESGSIPDGRYST
ncbi:MAG: ferredoxin-thioredoxin reductase catalytic domain-containing protein [Spirochaetota bacterium]